MGTSRVTIEYSRRVGMWSTIAVAVQGGWGSTGRLLTIFAVLGALCIGVVNAVDGSDILVMLRSLLAGIR